jgi:hypothetical protein
VLDDEIWMMPGHVVLGLAALAASPASGTGTPTLALVEKAQAVSDYCTRTINEAAMRHDVDGNRRAVTAAIDAIAVVKALQAPAGTGTCGECRHGVAQNDGTHYCLTHGIRLQAYDGCRLGFSPRTETR